MPSSSAEPRERRGALRFVVEGAAIVEIARQRVLEGAWRHALRIVMTSLIGVGYDDAISILSGQNRLTGDSSVGIRMEPEARAARRAHESQVRWRCRGVWEEPGCRHYQAYAYVDNWGAEDFPPEAQHSEFTHRTGRLDPMDGGRRSRHYADDPARDVVVAWDDPERGAVHVLARAVDVPPWVKFPCAAAEALRPAHARRRLEHRGHAQRYGVPRAEIVVERSDEGPLDDAGLPVVSQPPPRPPRDPAVPCWDPDVGHSFGGGTRLADVRPQPPVRRFPHPGIKRGVTAKISTWVGTSIGARHWYASVEEEANPVWDARGDGCWCEPKDDLVGLGRRFPAREPDGLVLHDRVEFVDQPDRAAYDQAKDWIDRVIKDYFSGGEHAVEVEDYGNLRGAPAWRPHDGD